MKVRDIIRAMESDGWRMEKRTGTSHRKFSHSSKPGKVTIRSIGRGSSDRNT
jgi:predicted RNA binding protein YcfA (HicA-like mRNA interferase family)